MLWGEDFGDRLPHLACFRCDARYRLTAEDIRSFQGPYGPATSFHASLVPPLADWLGAALIGQSQRVSGLVPDGVLELAGGIFSAGVANAAAGVKPHRRSSYFLTS